MTPKYDREADAIYISLAKAPYAYGKDLDKERRIDYAADGTPIGVEITCVSAGVEIEDLPQSAAIARLLGKLHIRVYA
jgi:uncharacterized protein YuzE